MPTIATAPSFAPVGAALPQPLPAASSGAASAPVGAVVAVSTPPFRGFGYVQYVPISSEPGVLFQPGVRVPLAMPVGAPNVDTLAGPFAGWVFWSGTDFAARAVGDAYDIRLTLIARSTVAAGAIMLDATVNGAATPIETDQDFLGADAGEDQVLSFHVKLYPKGTFVTGGARVYIKPTVPMLITNSKLIIEPTNAG